MGKLNILLQLLNETEKLPHRNEEKLDALLKKTEMVLRNIFGETSKYLTDLERILFSPSVYPTGDHQYNKSWNSGKSELINLLNTTIEELKLFGDTTSTKKTIAKTSKINDKSIFIVHGNDVEMKQNVARTIEKLGFKPLILHEKPNKSRTIIEKFTDYSNVSFAIILLSPDDIAYPKTNTPKERKYRARQNVIFEMGFFIGKLGREHVLVLFQEDENFEMPSDYSGVLYTAYEKTQKWQFELVKELKACGYDVDANKLLE